MTVPRVPAELLDSVVAYFHPRQVILFGSAARGEAGPGSDFDLLVVLDDDAPTEMLTAKAAQEARRILRGEPVRNPVNLHHLTNPRCLVPRVGPPDN